MLGEPLQARIDITATKDAAPRHEPDRETWKKCFELYLEAFRTPKLPADQKKLAKILKKPLDPMIENAFFEYDAFLHGLGRVSLSMFFSVI